MNSSKDYIKSRIINLSSSIMPKGSQLILFGSQARGDANEESDWDLLIILDKPKIEQSDRDLYCYPLYELGWEIDEQIHPIVYTKKDWTDHKGISLLYHNVQEEGIVLC